MQQTITDAARLYGKARSTIHRAIESGRLSCTVRGDGVRVIDLAELIRLWGEPPHPPKQTQQNATPQNDDAQQALLQELRALREEVRQLREQMQRLPPPTPSEAPTAPPQQAKEPKQGNQPPRTLADVLARFEGKQ